MDGDGRTIALLGSGEFEPWTEDLDRRLLDGADGERRVLILPTASAPEGGEVFARWASKGLEHYDRMEVAAEVVPLRERVDAERPEVVEMLDEASIAYFSGGNPAYLVETLRGTAFWDRLVERLGEGMAFIGCSAGAVALGVLAMDSEAAWRRREYRWVPGLGVVDGALIVPHFDTADRYLPGILDLARGVVPDGCRLLGIDEDTAVVGDGERWEVAGKGRVSIEHGEDRETHAPGATFEVPLRRQEA